jgi:hypothetical protein
MSVESQGNRPSPYLAKQYRDGEVVVTDKWGYIFDIFKSKPNGEKKLARREDRDYAAISLSEIVAKATVPVATLVAAESLVKRKPLITLGVAVIEPLVLLELQGMRAVFRYLIKDARRETDVVKTAQKSTRQLPEELQPWKS